MPRNSSNTRATPGSGTIRKKIVHQKGKEYIYWEGRITVGRDPSTGKQLQRSFTGKAQKEVLEKMQAAAVAVRTGDYFKPSKIALSDWIRTWLEDYTGDKKYLTVKHYQAQCNTHIIPHLGAVKLSELTTQQIQSFYNTLQRNGLSPKSIRTGIERVWNCSAHGKLCKAFGWRDMGASSSSGPNSVCRCGRRPVCTAPFVHKENAENACPRD